MIMIHSSECTSKLHGESLAGCLKVQWTDGNRSWYDSCCKGEEKGYMDLSKGRRITSPRTIIPLGIVYNYCYHHFWIRFRVLGWRGLLIKDIRIYPLLFSERSGFTRVLFPRLWWALIILGKPWTGISPRWTGEK